MAYIPAISGGGNVKAQRYTTTLSNVAAGAYGRHTFDISGLGITNIDNIVSLSIISNQNEEMTGGIMSYTTTEVGIGFKNRYSAALTAAITLIVAYK